MITDKEVKRAIEIYRMIGDHKLNVWLKHLFIYPKYARTIAEEMLDFHVPIEIDLSVTKDEDIAPMIIWNMLNEAESEEK